MNELALSAQVSRRQRRVLAFAALLLVPLACVGIVRFLLNPVAFANRHVDRIERIAREVLGQQLTIGSFEGHLYPELDVTVHDVVLSERDSSAEPMLMLPSVRLQFRLRHAIVTFGRELSLESVHVEGGVLRVHRDLAGDIDVLDVLKKLPPLDPRDLAGGVLSSFTVDHAQVRFVDERVDEASPDGSSHEIVIGDVHIETSGPIALGESAAALVTATWGDSDRPATAEVSLDALPADLVLWPPPSASVHVNLPATDLESATAWLGLPPLFAGGVVDVDIAAHTGAGLITGTVDVDGTGVSAVVTSGAGAGVESVGEVSEASLRSDVRIAVDGWRTELDNFAFHGAGIAIDGRADFARLPLGGIEDVETLDVLVRADELARLGLLIPPLRNTTPGALALSGAGSGTLQASPTSLVVDLELDEARVVLGEALAKRAGERLQVRLVGTRDGQRAARVDAQPDARSNAQPEPDARLGARADDASSPGRIDATLRAALPHGVVVTGAAVFQPRGVDVAFFDLKTNRTTLANAAALSPVVRDIVDGSVRGGSLTVAMQARMSAADNAFQFRLAGRALDVVVDNSVARGDATVNIGATTDASGLRLRIAGDLARLSLETSDAAGKVLFAKPAGDALDVRASLREVGGPGSLGRALAALDPASKRGGAVFTGNGLSPRWRRFALGLDGRGSVRAAHAELMGLSLDDAGAELALRNGRLRLAPATVRVLSGRASLSQSVIDLRAQPAQWAVLLDVDDIELARVLEPMRAFTGDVGGTAELHGRLRGTGLSLEALFTSLDGPVVVRTRDVHIAAVDSLSRSIDGLWRFVEQIPGVSRADVEKTRGDSPADALREGEWIMRFHGNQFRLDVPLVTLTSLGPLTLAGHAALDGSIDFTARLDLAPSALVVDAKSATDDHVVTASVQGRISGTWAAPIVTTSNLEMLRDTVKRSLEAGLASTLKDAADVVKARVDELRRSFEAFFGVAPAPAAAPAPDHDDLAAPK